MSEIRDPRVADYYHSLQRFYDTIFEESGYYNLGWQPEGERLDFSGCQQQLVRLVAEPLKPFTNGIILDIGCGQGAPAEQVSRELAGNIVGLELLHSQLETCRKRRSPALWFVRGDAGELPFGTASVAGIYSIESAFHYPDKAAFIRECGRVLKPGGMLSLADIMRKSGKTRQFSLKRIARAAGTEEFYSGAQYRNAADSAGLEVIRSEDISAGISRSFRKISDKTFRHWKTLREHYSVRVLFSAFIAARMHGYYYRYLPVEYRWMVFRKVF